MGHRQAGKKRKRSKAWHKGKGTGSRFERLTKNWPIVDGVEHDGAPAPGPGPGGSMHRGK